MLLAAADEQPQQNMESFPWLTMRVKAKSAFGVIAYVISRDLRHQATIELDDGRAMVGLTVTAHHLLQVDYGGVLVEQSPMDTLNISDAQWHSIVVDVRDGHVHLTIDDKWKYVSQRYHTEHIDSFDGECECFIETLPSDSHRRLHHVADAQCDRPVAAAATVLQRVCHRSAPSRLSTHQ